MLNTDVEMTRRLHVAGQELTVPKALKEGKVMSSWGSKDSQVHVANGLGRKIYVFVTPDPTWAWADVAGMVVQLAATAAFTAASGGTAAPAQAAAVSAAATQVSTIARAVNTAKQLFELVKALKAFKMAMAVYQAYSYLSKAQRVAQAATATLMRDVDNMVHQVVGPLKMMSIEIPPGAFRLVNKDNYLSVWNSVNPSYWGSIAGANTVQLTIFDESLSHVSTFSTGADESWIATNNAIKRAQYGSIWRVDNSAGWEDWQQTSAQADTVMVFEHKDYRGASSALVPGVYNMDQTAVGDNRLSSMLVPSGWQVTLYTGKYRSGRSWRYTGDTSFVGGTVNDTVSSIYVKGPKLTAVALYQHTNYRGRKQLLSKGRHNLRDLSIGNDALSSLRVPQGWTVTLYKHSNFSGTTRTVRGNEPDLGTFNDLTSSIIVSSTASARVIIYEHSNYRGAAQAMGVGQYNMSRIAIGNDTLSSLRIPPGWSVTLYEHSNFGGRRKTFTRDTSFVGNEFNDWASSLVISHR